MFGSFGDLRLVVNVRVNSVDLLMTPPEKTRGHQVNKKLKGKIFSYLEICAIWYTRIAGATHTRRAVVKTKEKSFHGK